ncbi:hypothetical protein CAPTEDRAFT_225284 [Capitella teleta]|uniref:SHSP domain-containing protein n=1 Tax=Capitella teleta TaxID=283909 RepID=R7U5P4_CAPTE|nr:hypothetical protein CAPTEDRAFT_225284 [Capitella teleta]|eukprot:ELT98465.1 hypothetical protein CAPTEDRAFT_225284 [Capitella teleta]
MAYELFPQLLQPHRYRMSPMRLAYDPFSDLFSELGGTCQWMPLSTGDKKQATKPKAPAALNWQEIVQIPEVFSPSDVQVKEEGADIIIRAHSEKGSEETGLVRHELLRRLKVPEDIDRETLKTLWLNRSHGLVVVGKRKTKEVEKGQVEKGQPTEPEAEHPLAFLLEHFGVPGYAQCECQKKPQQPGTAEKSSSDATEEKKEVEKSEGEKKSEEKQASGETSSEVAVNGDKTLAFEVKPFKITVDITGYDKDDVKVDHHGNRIAVCGEHQEDRAEYSFAKAFTLPDFVDVDKLKWNIDEKNSALVITAPML